MSGVGAPKGNRNAAKGKLFEGVLRRALMENDGEKLRKIAEMIVSKAEAGDLMAARELMDRLDGKPKQQVELSGDAENPLHIFTHAAADLLDKIRGGS